MNYDVERPGEKAGTRMLIGCPGGRRIKLVVDDRGDAVVIITSPIEEPWMQIEYDEQADALYIPMGDTAYSRGTDLDDRRRIDYADDGSVVGIELLFPSLGIDIDGLPLDARTIETLQWQYKFVVHN
jgi:uncharacterized protein YuzE